MASPVLEALRTAIDEIEKKRLENISRAWEAYGGDHPDSLEIGQDDVDDNLEENLCRLVVKKGVAKLIGSRLEFEIVGSERDDDGKAKNDEAIAEDFIETILEKNRRPRLLRNYATNGGVSGHAFGKIIPKKEDVDPDNPTTFPKIRAVDPGYVDPSWEEDDYEEIWRYRISYVGTDREERPVLIRQEIEKIETDRNDEGVGWEIRDQRADVYTGADLRDYTPTRIRAEFSTVNTVLWPFPDPPVFENQNLPAANQYWGESDLESDVIDLNYGLNAVLSNMNRIVRIYAHPRAVASGLTAAELAEVDVSPDGLLNLPNPNAKLSLLEPKADLRACLDLYKLIRQGFHEVTHTPEVATGKLEGIGQLSGLALQILFGPLVERTTEKRDTYGEAIIALLLRLLRLGLAQSVVSAEFLESVRIILKWPEILPDDPEAARRVATLDRDLGVSRKTTLEKLGYDAEAETDRRREEAEQEEAAFNRGEGGAPNVGTGATGAGAGGAGGGGTGGG